MKDKKTARERFLDAFLDGVEDWDKHLTDAVTEEEDAQHFEISMKIIEEQEEFGNRTNWGLGREMWYSNDFFINSLILDFITDDPDDELNNELKKVYVGMLPTPGFNAEALNRDEECEGYLITIRFEVDLQLTFMSTLVSCLIYGLKAGTEEEMNNLLPTMKEALSDLTDKEALDKKLHENKQFDEQVDKQIDHESPRLHIAADLFAAGMSSILGHEIGHHFLKHTESNGRNIVAKFIPTEVTFNQLHLDEFAADRFSFDLLIKRMKEKNDNILFAPLMVILMIALEENPEEPSQTHPSLKNRYLNLLSEVSKHDEAVALRLQETFNHVATWINIALGGRWETEWWK